AALLSVACLPAFDLTGIGTIADIGGGTGDLLAALLEANPNLRGILVDSPSMLERAHHALVHGPLAAGCQRLPGDLFSAAPAADAYVLAQVLHDWDDHDASRILRAVRTTARAGARLFVLTLLIREGSGMDPAKTADIG